MLNQIMKKTKQNIARVLVTLQRQKSFYFANNSTADSHI